MHSIFGIFETFCGSIYGWKLSNDPLLATFGFTFELMVIVVVEVRQEILLKDNIHKVHNSMLSKRNQDQIILASCSESTIEHDWHLLKIKCWC
jgi:hypothetical protein